MSEASIKIRMEVELRRSPPQTFDFHAETPEWRELGGWGSNGEFLSNVRTLPKRLRFAPSTQTSPSLKSQPQNLSAISCSEPLCNKARQTAKLNKLNRLARSDGGRPDKRRQKYRSLNLTHLLYVCGSVHHSIIHIENSTRFHTVLKYYFIFI
jgi:hypothetical protein